MKRRQFFAAATAAGISGLTTVAAAAAVTKAHGLALDPSAIRSGLGKKIPINKERAYEVMDQFKIDGLIALRPHNVYYLTNTNTTLQSFLNEYPAFGTFPRDPQQPSFLLSSMGNTWETSNGDREVPQVIAFSGAANWQEYIDATPEKLRIEPEAAGKQRKETAVQVGATLSVREEGWKRANETYGPASAANQAWAVVHALKQSGLAKGRIAVDDMRIAFLLQRIGFDSVTIIPGDNIFRHIRQVKTENEIALMRVAQRITSEAMTTAARALEEGMTYDDFRFRFMAETAARGGEPGFVLLGSTQGNLPDGVVKRGRTYLLDGSSHFKNYQGDFARTVAIGEPSAENMKRFKAQQVGREAGFEIIKPGVPYSKVTSVARAAMVKAGMPAEIAYSVMHAVGLQHTDDPVRDDVAFDAPVDPVLAENMTITLDLPYVQLGGGCGHNEDLLRITKTGFEILNDPREPLIVV